ncbi:MAG: DUF1592 domain-containing protein [Verrucomicrobiota bacterium]
MLKWVAPIFLATATTVLADPRAEYEAEIEPLLDIYCYECHAEGIAEGAFSMDKFEDLSAHLEDREHWMPIWRNVRSQIMPPSDEDQLEVAEKKKLLRWIESRVFRLDPGSPDPGRVTIRRLNRTEYRYAVFDLLGVDFDTGDFFPPDDSGYGFDNIGDVLSISPLLMEKYIAAAEEVVMQALPEGDAAQVPQLELVGGDFREENNPKETGRWMEFERDSVVKSGTNLEWDGRYRVTLDYAIRGSSEATDQEARMRLRIAGKEIGEEALGWDQRELIQLSGEIDLKKGSVPIDISLKPTRPAGAGQEHQALVVKKLSIVGPLGGIQRQYSKGYRMIFVDGEPPEDPVARERYARKIMRSFVSRAFRRPIEKPTIDRLVKIVEEVDTRPGKDFEDGIREAIMTCLCSPRFLFRVEIQPEPNNPEKIVPLDEYALAARLSFFLWSSVPDDELLSLAFNGKLRENLDAQIDRMLADWRSQRLVQNFVGQWLQVRDVESIQIEPHVILGLRSRREGMRQFDYRLRDDMRRESEMLFDFILREGRPAEELISARYSFLNGRLAEYYGIDRVSGEKFVPVDLTEHPERGGVLTQGSFLIVSSNPTRTSPVKRGLFVLDNLLGTPAPPAPPDVPELEEAASGGEKPTMREMMEIHRRNPDCRGCHARMDPIGLGLENFDAIGRFRREEHGKPIDSAGQLVTGEKFANVAELKEILANSRREDFYRCLAEKMLTYAIGRGVEYYDATTIQQLVDRLEEKDGSLRELIYGVVESAPFQKRRGSE